MKTKSGRKIAMSMIAVAMAAVLVPTMLGVLPGADAASSNPTDTTEQTTASETAAGTTDTNETTTVSQGTQKASQVASSHKTTKKSKKAKKSKKSKKVKKAKKSKKHRYKRKSSSKSSSSSSATAPRSGVAKNKMNSSEKALAKKIFKKYNAYRASKGLRKVKWSNDCANMAYKSAKGCSKAGTLIHDLGIPSKVEWHYADILQWSNWKMSASEAVKNWRNSTGHRRMMQCTTSNVAGVACYKDSSGNWYYVIVYNWAHTNQNGN
ncbi:MAG: CAP domain-containing protein [Coriobacteriales bacterium]